MTIYYQQSRVSSVAFVKTENDLSEIPNYDSNSQSILKIDPKFEKLTYLNELELKLNELQKQSRSESESQTLDKQSDIENIKNKINEIKHAINLEADVELSNLINLIKTSDNINTIIINAESPIFHDIEFSVDTSKVEINSESIHQDPLSGISLGNSAMLDSLMDQHFVIIPGRKAANIKSNLNQNHECIDALSANGLMNSPKIMSEYSVGKLIEAISNNKNLKNLNIYIIHSALKVKCLYYTGISDINRPCYAVGRGEILSVFFRYIALTFFPYMTVYDAKSSIDYKYDI